jgi:hypothetical protein
VDGRADVAEAGPHEEPLMKLVMTLLARDEADIVEAQLRFHLHAGVDLVVATDNGSSDGTTEILETYAKDGHVHLIRNPSDDVPQWDWVTGMARLAATDFGADWVINSDADEFWWPRSGSLKEIFSAVPTSFGCVRGMWRHFVPRPEGAEFFAERMTVRVCNPGAAPDSPYSPRFKTAHRADPEVKVGGGNHQAFGRGLRPLRSWYPIDVLHFPMRSLEQCERKYLRLWEVFRTGFGGLVHEAHRDGRIREFYESHVVDDETLAREVADGTLAVDTRLRDALGPDSSPSSSGGRTVDDGYLSEFAALEQTDPLVHAQGRLEGLEKRLASLEKRPLSRVGGRLFGRVTAEVHG